MRRFFFLLFMGVLLWSGVCQAIGVLTITNQTIPRVYTLGSDPITLDSGMVFTHDNSATPNYYVGASSFTEGAAWPSGNIYVTIDALPNGNICDQLSCTLSNANMRSSYDVVNRTLTIKCNSTISYSDIQTTLRTLTFYADGQASGTRNIRIWVETPGYKFANSRNGRLYLAHSTGGTGWSSVVITRYRRFGLSAYFSSVVNDTEETAAGLIGGSAAYQFWLGGYAGTLSGVTWTSFSGSISTSTTTPVWSWVDGPDAGRTFWKGDKTGSSTGTDTGYARWLYSNVSSSTRGEPSSGTEYWVNIAHNAGYDDATDTGWNNYSITTIACSVLEFGGVYSPIINPPLPYTFGTPGSIAADENFITIRVFAPNSLRMGLPF